MEGFMLEERSYLCGNKNERIVQALRKAGWYDGRKAEISSVLTYYKKWNIELNEYVILFFEEYYGIAGRWYIEVENLAWGPDFEFLLFPYPENQKMEIVDFMYDDSEYRMESEEYRAVKEYAKENIILVGEIGYYYPARVWIGNSGTFYCTHDYEEDCLKFDSVIALISYELSAHEFSSVAMRR